MSLSRSSNQSSAGAAAGAKKMVIKPFKTQPKLPENYEKDTWVKLESAVRAVNNKTATLISKEELYRAVEDLCMHKLGGKIYDNLANECQSHIYSKVDSLVGQIGDHTAFLGFVDVVWREHCEQMNTVRNIFLYLDRSYALQTPGIKSLWDLGLDLFRRRLEDRIEVQAKIITGLLASVDAERNGMSVDRDILKRLIRMLVSVGIYGERFEVPFLAESRRFFREEGMALMTGSPGTMISSVISTGDAGCDPAGYLIHAERRIQEASEMVNRYLDVSTRLPLLQAIEAGLLVPHVPQLIERGLGPMLDAVATSASSSSTAYVSTAAAATTSSGAAGGGGSGSGVSAGGGGGGGERLMADLRRLFTLIDRVGASEQLKIGWGAYIRRVGEALVSSEENDKTMIEDLLIFQERIESVLKLAFSSNEGFRYAMKAAFEHFINIRQNKPAELLARFVDKKMRGEKGLGDAEVDAQLDKVMALFRFLNGKDVFEAFYKKLLAKRLLLSKSASYDLERSMLTKLKTECGSNFTAKLEGMFQDVELSRDTMNAFLQYQTTQTTKRTATTAAAAATTDVLSLPTGGNLGTGDGAAGAAAGVGVDVSRGGSLESTSTALMDVGEGGELMDVVEDADGDATTTTWRDTGGSAASELNSRNTSSSGLAATTAASATASGGMVASTSLLRPEPEASFQVLTTGYWPATTSTEGIILPPELLLLQDRFTTFYTGKYQGRRLLWTHSLQRCVVTARFPKGKKELEVTLFQALVLLCFNKSERLVLRDLRELTGLEDGELRRTLQSLACGVIGTRTLTKEPKGRDVNDGDVFSYNSDFVNKLYRIKVNTIQLRETAEETEQTHEEVFRDRQYQVDAVIVRTMKSRKRMAHTALMGELLAQLRFPARPVDIKKRIESLIEREYLERDKEDSSFYNYLA